MIRSPAEILRVPGSFIIDPTQQPVKATFDTDYPFGGTVLGNTRGVYFLRYHGGFTIWAEERGAPSDQLEPHDDYAAGCFLRGYDKDAVDHLWPNTRIGAVTGKPVVQLTGTRKPGARISERASKLLFCPDAPNVNPGFVANVALPLVEDASRILMQWGEDYGFPAIWRFVEHETLGMGEKGFLWDISVA